MPGPRVSNTCFHHHAIKTALWWAPSSTVLTLNSNLPPHTHTELLLYFRPTGFLCRPQGDPSQVLCSVFTSSLCLRRFHFGQCGCSFSAPLGLKVIWEDVCRQRHWHKLPMDIQHQHLLLCYRLDSSSGCHWNTLIPFLIFVMWTLKAAVAATMGIHSFFLWLS